MAIRDVRESKGFGISVSDEEILDAIRYLGSVQGIFAEPAGATGFAGFLKSLKQGVISKNDKIVVLVTGNGLKDVESAIRAGGEPIIIDPDIDAVKKVLKKI